MKTLKTIPTLLIISFLNCNMFAQNKTIKNIENTGNAIENTEKTIKNGKELIGKFFKKNKKEDRNENADDKNIKAETDYFMEFTIGGEKFYMDVYNDSRWYTFHAKLDKENEQMSGLFLQGWKMGFADGGKTAYFTLSMVPKDRQIKPTTYRFEKGSSSFEPMAFFKFDDDKTSYEMAKPGGTNIHQASGEVSISLCENVEHGIIEGSFKLQDITISKGNKIISENNSAEGTFRVPVNYGMPTTRPKPRTN
jgi:hypothetical protein